MKTKYGDPKYRTFNGKRYEHFGGLPRSKSEANKVKDELSNMKRIKAVNDYYRSKGAKTRIAHLFARIVKTRNPKYKGKYILYVRRNRIP